MLRLYVDWRAFRRIAPFVLVGVVGGALLINHGGVQLALQQTFRGRGLIADTVRPFDHETQHDVR